MQTPTRFLEPPAFLTSPTGVFTKCSPENTTAASERKERPDAREIFFVSSAGNGFQISMDLRLGAKLISCNEAIRRNPRTYICGTEIDRNTSSCETVKNLGGDEPPTTSRFIAEGKSKTTQAVQLRRNNSPIGLVGCGGPS